MNYSIIAHLIYRSKFRSIENGTSCARTPQRWHKMTGSPHWINFPNTEVGHGHVCAREKECEHLGAEKWGRHKFDGLPDPNKGTTQTGNPGSKAALTDDAKSK